MAHGRQYRQADYEYGPTCPECAGPKWPKAGMCRDCYTDARRRHEYPLPPLRHRDEAKQRRPSGGSRGRPQPADHPWRKAEALRLAEIRRAA